VRSRTKAYSYLSLVNGIFSRHDTWAECEACVKGEKGAKYRKAVSVEDEAAIKKEWGV
jgi:viroplasmin and RNaseH domain-containing protein